MWLFQSSSESLRWFGKIAISQTHLFFLKVLLHSGEPPYCICLNFNMYLFKCISYWFVTITILPNFSCCESFIARRGNLFCENAHITSLKRFLQNNRHKDGRVNFFQRKLYSARAVVDKSQSGIWFTLTNYDANMNKLSFIKFVQIAMRICLRCKVYLSE